jgi:hypothetical protein
MVQTNAFTLLYQNYAYLELCNLWTDGHNRHMLNVSAWGMCIFLLVLFSFYAFRIFFSLYLFLNVTLRKKDFLNFYLEHTPILIQGNKYVSRVKHIVLLF